MPRSSPIPAQAAFPKRKRDRADEAMKETVFFTAPLSALSPALWADAFSENIEEVREMIALLSPDATAVLANEGERTVFQGVLIPVLLGEELGYYLYALATAADRRGRGYLRRALAYIRDRAREEGVSFLLLIADDEALAAAYRRMGFSESLPLAASRDGRTGYLDLPPLGDERSFDGDCERLYAMTGRSLSYSAFAAYLASLPDDTAILYTKDGFRLRAAADARFCLYADERTLTDAATVSGDAALLLPLVPALRMDRSMLADPLPR